MNDIRKCNKGWHDGSCCCNCKNQIKLFKHPWNEINKGSCSEESGLFACIVEHILENTQKGIIFEKEHGFCELHITKD